MQILRCGWNWTTLGGARRIAGVQSSHVYTCSGATTSSRVQKDRRLNIINFWRQPRTNAQVSADHDKMPLGWERINAKTSGPNKNIVFIKPLEGPDKQTSKDFLERIAAQCLPVMNKNYLAVTSLEEYPANKEFWGVCYLLSATADANNIRSQLQRRRGHPACS